FSLAGKPPSGVRLARLEGPGLVRCRLSRCYVRGDSWTAIDVQTTPANVLLDGCLIVGSDRPLLDTLVVEGTPVTLRLVRSTLIAGGDLLRIREPAGKESDPQVRCLAWDSLLSRAGTVGDGNLIHLVGSKRRGKLGWRGVNCVYAGWNKLL